MGLSPTRYFTVHCMCLYYIVYMYLPYLVLLYCTLYVLVLYSLYVPALPGIIILYTVCACTI